MTMFRLLLVTDAIGGVWVYSLELARALRPLGIETKAIGRPGPGQQQTGLQLVQTAPAHPLGGNPLDIHHVDLGVGKIFEAACMIEIEVRHDDVSHVLR